jgi:uncharacterized protein (TIGR03437 family)
MEARLMRFRSSWLILYSCGAAFGAAANLGVQVNGGCVSGSCPAQLLAPGGSVSLPVGSEITLANGDVYAVTGTETSTNSASGTTFGVTYLFQVVFVKGASGSTSQGDSITIDLFAGYQSSAGTGNFGEVLTGGFSANIAGGSSVQLCTDGVCTSAATPPGTFNTSANYSQNASGGGFLIDNTFTVHFGAGSPAGSYVLLNFPALAVPEVTPGGAFSAGAFGGSYMLAPGTWVEIYGANLATGTLTWGSADFNGVNAPTTLGGTSVTIGGQPAYIDFVSPGQVNVQVPSGIGTGAQTLIVKTAAGSSASSNVNLGPTSPGLLAPPALKLNGVQYLGAFFSDGTFVLPPGAIAGINSRRARPGDTITLYGIGFGPVTPAISPGQIEQASNSLATAASFSIGGTSAASTFAGLAPNYVGLYQFNLVVPNIAASDSVPVTFSQGGVAGIQTVNIAVGN